MTDPDYRRLVDEAPPPLAVPGARAVIAARNAEAGWRTAVLDDDPTGSQCVHDVQIVLAPEASEYRRALAEPGATAFVLTNSRSLDAAAADRLNEHEGVQLHRVAAELGGRLRLVSRSDSTLRGHLWTEVGALARAARSVTGRGFDAVLLAPAYLEAGRVTAGDVHWARVGGQMVPVGQTEFARDTSFGYRASNLRDWVAELSGGAVRRDEVASLSLHDIRVGGPPRVAELLRQVVDGRFVVVNATDQADLDVVALGVLDAEAAGHQVLLRTGPSMVRSLAGVPDRGRLGPADIWRDGRDRGGFGLVVVGSHVGLTNSQLDVALRRGDLREVELPVDQLAGGEPADDTEAVVQRVAGAVRDGLREGHVLLRTSRTVRTGADAEASLAIARRVSGALSATVHAVRELPSWVIAKGGITSHDVAVHGLGIRRATVLGQLLDSQVSVFAPTEVEPGSGRAPYVVFAGNVGDENTLSYAIDVLA